MSALLVILVLLLGFIPEHDNSNISHPKPFGDDSQSVADELLAEGAFGTHMKELILRNGQVALVDDDIFEIVSEFTWSVDYNGYVARWYREPRSDKSKRGKLRQIRIQNVVLPPREGFMADHKFHNLLDNRRSQLRYSTHRTNGRNRVKQKGATTSRFKGVCFVRRVGRWMGYVGGGKNGRNTHLGYFTTEEAAAEAYNNAAKIRFGEFACLNKL